MLQPAIVEPMVVVDGKAWHIDAVGARILCGYPEGYERFRGRFHAVLDPALYPPEWLDAQIFAGLFQFMATDKAAIVFDVKVYPSGLRDVHGLIAAGELADIRDVLIPRAEQWGREHGCTGGIIESREGWAKALGSSGYAPYQIALRKVL